MEPYEARGEQLAAQPVLFGRREGVVDEEGVADGLVDDAIEDVCEELALFMIDFSKESSQDLFLDGNNITSREQRQGNEKTTGRTYH